MTLPNDADLSSKHLLLIGTGGIKRKPVLSALRSLGLGRITCLNDARNWAAPWVDDWIEADAVRPRAETLALVQARIGRPDAVLTYDDYSVVLAAYLADELGLPSIGAEAARRAKDKNAFRASCVAHGIGAPAFCRLDPASPDWAAFDASGVTFPAVTKPTHGAGSILVRRVDSRAALRASLAELAGALPRDPAAQAWIDHSVLVESYIAGAEVDIDLLVQDGRVRYAAVSDNFAPEEPFFLERGGRIPSALPERTHDELVGLAARTLSALGVENACVHFEARWSTEHGAVPIEANLRLGGAEVYAFHNLAFETDLVHGAVRIALGLPIGQVGTPAAIRCARSHAFIPPRSGTLRRIGVDPILECHPGFGEIVLFRDPGTEVNVPPDGFDYVGWLVAHGTSDDAAARALRELTAMVHIEVDERTSQR